MVCCTLFESRLTAESAAKQSNVLTVGKEPHAFPCFWTQGADKHGETGVIVHRGVATRP